MNNRKVKDTGKDISKGSRLDQYWNREGFSLWFHKLRHPKPKLKGTESIHELYELIISGYNFSGVEFGNWVNNETRFNYLLCAGVALEDIHKVVKFNNTNLGIKKLGLAFGARGQGAAKGHFEPANWIINLTRYGRDESFDSGGVGALAHEYGHFLDYYFGTFVDKNWQYRSLTKGRSVAKFPENNDLTKNTLHGLANEIVFTCIWRDKTYSIETDYYLGLKKKFGDNEYWFRHNEIFARAFEQYVFNKLKQLKINNYFLTSFKYDSKAYLDPALAKKVSALFDKLLKKMREKI